MPQSDFLSSTEWLEDDDGIGGKTSFEDRDSTVSILSGEMFSETPRNITGAQLVILKSDKITQFKGDVIEVRPLNAPIGGDEINHFIFIKVTNAEENEFSGHGNSWDKELGCSMIHGDIEQDGYTFRIESNNVGRTGTGAVVEGDVSTFLTGWNCTITTTATNKIDFTANIYSMITSIANFYYMDKFSNFSFSEISYSSGTGIHRVQLTYGASSGSDSIAGIVMAMGGIVISNNGTVCVFDIPRTIILDRFHKQFNTSPFINRIIIRRKFHIDTTEVDSIVSSGGTVEYLRNNTLLKLKNKAVE